MKVFVLTRSSYDFREGGTTILNGYSSYDDAEKAARKETHDLLGFEGPEQGTDDRGHRYWTWSVEDGCDRTSYEILEMELL